MEDNEDDALLTLRALERSGVDTGDVVAVRDGAEALDYLHGCGAYRGRDTEFMPLLILLDIQLPHMSGLEVLRHLRTTERTKDIPVVMLTSSAEERDLADSYGFGANSYVQKPVDSEGFNAAVLKIAEYWVGLNEPPPECQPTPGTCLNEAQAR